MTRAPAIVAVLAVAAFAAGVATAASTDTTATTETAPATVTVTTERTATVQTTVQQTVQQTVTLGPTNTEATTAPATTSSSSSSSSFPTWAIVLIVVGGIGLIVAVAFLLGRGKRGGDSSLDGRRRILDAAVSSSVASGWTVESTGPTEAVIRNNGERAMLTVDEHGQINRRRLESDERPPE